MLLLPDGSVTRHLWVSTRDIGTDLKVIKLFIMLNSTEHKINYAHTCSNAINRWHFNIY